MKVLLIGNRPGFHCRMRKLLNGLGGGMVFSEAPDFGEAVSMGECGDMVGLVCVDVESVRHRALHDLLRLQGAYPSVPIAMFDGNSVQAGSNALMACHALDETIPGDAQRAVLSGLGEMLGIRTEGPVDAGSCEDARLKRLTEREREVLHHLMSGLSNKAIARLLALQEVTVKAHLRQVFRKLGVTNRTQATALAMTIYGGHAQAGRRRLDQAGTAGRVAASHDRRPHLDAALAHAA